MRHIIISISLILIFGQNSFGQTRSIQGRIISENIEILPGVKIQNSDTVLLGKTDIKGYFDIEIPLNTKELLISWIGMESVKIQLSSECDVLEIIMMNDVNYNYNSAKKIDRLRKERFINLTKIHQKAFEKEIFKTDKPCFSRDFKSIQPELERIGKEMKQKRDKIKETFKALSVKDTIRVPFSGSFRHDGTDRTSLFVYSYVVNDTGFDCLIEGAIIDKNRHKRGYNLFYKITNLDMCNYDSIIYNGNTLNLGDTISHNMKYYKVLVKN